MTKCSGRKYWFICNECNHSFDITISNIVSGNWCRFCSSSVLCKNECSVCYNKSFASSEKAKYWDYTKNAGTPRDVSKGSDKKCWFICDKCDHSFELSLNKVKNRWCPYCGGRKICKNDCAPCFDRSMASSNRAHNWNYVKNSVSPRDFFKSTAKKYWFICDFKHDVYTSPNSISRGRFCPICKNKTERKLFDEFNLYPLKAQIKFQ